MDPLVRPVLRTHVLGGVPAAGLLPLLLLHVSALAAPLGNSLFALFISSAVAMVASVVDDNGSEGAGIMQWSP